MHILLFHVIFDFGNLMKPRMMSSNWQFMIVDVMWTIHYRLESWGRHGHLNIEHLVIVLVSLAILWDLTGGKHLDGFWWVGSHWKGHKMHYKKHSYIFFCFQGQVRNRSSSEGGGGWRKIFYYIFSCGLNLGKSWESRESINWANKRCSLLQIH